MASSVPPPITEVDITALLKPKEGYLWKLGGGQETGSKWNRRWFVLRDNVLMYFQAPRDYNGFRDKPNGVVLLDECNVRERVDKTRAHTFMLNHPTGESVVLAAETENEMHEWMQAVRTSRMCIADAAAANMQEEQRRAAAEEELENARDRKTDPEAEIKKIEEDLAAVNAEHRQLEVRQPSRPTQVLPLRPLLLLLLLSSLSLSLPLSLSLSIPPWVRALRWQLVTTSNAQNISESQPMRTTHS